ncbi:Ion channel [Oesophagostomum dentatum]|uniref:Ion channel n=1 Tax=Oesophagostomum dentatum TaxID=61180 RepID=A0A0B1TMP1_OESDE|nr:Ion channel [Oesophagostomum dentatum]
MVYAIMGIPMVITILNDWGTIMFHAVDVIWKNNCRYIAHPLKRLLTPKERQESQESIYRDAAPTLDDRLSGNLDEEEPIPLFLVVIVLAFWILLCCVVFSHFEGWTFFEALYFFVISLTTIGFGDVTPSHSVAVANFLLILIGLSVVSMSINVIQMQLEILFGRIVKSIDSDFKAKLSVDEGKKLSITKTADLEHGVPALKPEKEIHKEPVDHNTSAYQTTAEGRLFLQVPLFPETDVAKQYGEAMHLTDRLLMRFMSHHQKKMLNEKFEERARMRNKWTQTTTQIKMASVQTTDKYEDMVASFTSEEEPEIQPKSRIAMKRLYIYNTGE